MFLDSASLPDDLDVPCNVISRSCFLAALQCFKMWKTVFFSQVFFTKISCLELVRELVFTGNWPCQNVAKVTFFLQTHTVFLKRLHIFWDKIRSIFFQNFPGIYRELLISRLRCFPRFPGKEQCYQLFIVFSTFSLPKCGQKLCVSPKSNVCYFFSQTSFFQNKNMFFRKFISISKDLLISVKAAGAASQDF